MQTRLYRRALPVLFCAASAIAPASAALTSRARISEMRISVADLTPDDDQPAGFSIADYRTNLVTRLETADRYRTDSDRPAAGMPGRAEIGVPGIGMATFTSGAIGEVISENHVATTAINLSSEGSQNWRLDLLPHSRLLIQGSMMVEALWTPQPNAWDYFAEGAARLTFSAEVGPSFQVSHWYRFSGNNQTQEVREAEDYTYVYENASDSVIAINYSGLVGGHARVSAVPEPGALPMLLVGIALLPAWHRQRRAASQPRRVAS